MSSQSHAPDILNPLATTLRRWSIAPGGVTGNARLTATTGLLLFCLLAAEGVTILSVHRLIAPHILIGLLLIPPVALKLASTGYRFVRFYTGNPRYRAAGPPQLLLRLLAPPLVLTTVGVLGSGVALLLGGRGAGGWLSLHKVSFFLWFFLMSVHVLAYLSRALTLARADILSGFRAPGMPQRSSLLLGSILLGIIIGVVGLSYDASWVHHVSHFRFDG